MSQYAHSVSVNYCGSVSLYFQPHDDISTAIFQSNKGCGSWTHIDFATMDAAEEMAKDMLAAIKKRREMTAAQIELQEAAQAAAIDQYQEELCTTADNRPF